MRIRYFMFLAAILCCLPLFAQTFTSGNLTYRVISHNPNQVCIEDSESSISGGVVIPAQVSDSSNTLYDVVRVGYCAFQERDMVTSILLPESVTDISDFAFDGCRSLASINIPEGVTKIGDAAFQNCSSLASVIIPKTVQSIGLNGFYGCTSLRTITFEASELDGYFTSVASLDEALLTVNCPNVPPSNALKYLFNEWGQFYNIFLGDLVTHIVQDGDQIYKVFDTHDGVRSAQAILLKGGKTSDVSVPERITVTLPDTTNPVRYYVVGIGPYAFYNRYVTSVTFNPRAQISIIGDGAFRCTKIYSIVLPEELTEIGPYAFYGCDDLAYIEIPSNVAVIGEHAFDECRSFIEVYINEGTDYLKIGEKAFPDKVEFLQLGRNTDYHFGNSLTKLYVGNTVSTLPSFENNSHLDKVQLGGALTEIPQNAFKNCALTEIVVPPNVTSIGADAFARNRLTTVYMGAEIKNIGENAFYDNPLKEVYVGAIEHPEAPTSAFSNYSGSLFVYENSVDDYYDAWTCWDRFSYYKHLVVPTSFNGDNGELISGEAGNRVRLTAYLQPSGVSMPYIFWESSNPDIATVDRYGYVTFHGGKPGTQAECKITAKTLYADVEPVVFNLRGTPTGISEVEVGDGWFGNGGAAVAGDSDIFNLQGVCIKRNASAEDIKALQPGIYIIAGKKTVVR